jgi:putative transposase
MASTLTNLLYHVVFSTKHREPLITRPLHRPLYDYLGGIIRGEGGALLEIGSVPDHVHLVVRLRSEPSLAQTIKTMKAKSSKWANEKPSRQGRFGWQIGYGAFTISPSQLPAVIKYVQTKRLTTRFDRFKTNLSPC